MKLSIIVSAYRQSKYLNTFLYSISEQKSENFEVLLYVDKPSSIDYKILDQYSGILKSKLKIFINLSARGGNSNWIEAIKKTTGDYVTIIYIEMIVKNNYVSEYEKIVHSFPVDIIETKPRFNGFFKWSPKARIKPKTVFDIVENKETVAYSYPFMFNKFIRNDIIKKMASFNITSPGNVKYWIELIYELFVLAKTYVYVDNVLINDWNETLDSFNSTSFIKQWKDIEEHFKNSHPGFLQEIRYAKIYHFLVFLAGMVGTGTRSHFWIRLKFKKNHKLISEKLNNHIKFLRENEFKHIIKVNKYFVTFNQETEHLIKFLPISKWHHIVDKF